MLGLGDDPFKFAAFRMMFRIFFTVFRFTNLTDSFHRAGGFAAVALVRLRVACISGADAGVGVVAVGLPLVPIMVGGVKRTVWLVAGCADRLSSTGGFAAGVRGIAILPRIDLHIAVFVGTLVPVMGRVRCPLLLPAVAGGRNRVRFGRAAYGTGIFSFARGRAGQLFRYRAIVPIMEWAASSVWARQQEYSFQCSFSSLCHPPSVPAWLWWFFSPDSALQTLHFALAMQVASPTEQFPVSVWLVLREQVRVWVLPSLFCVHWPHS